jgi:hypothetical protein
MLKGRTRDRDNPAPGKRKARMNPPCLFDLPHSHQRFLEDQCGP